MALVSIVIPCTPAHKPLLDRAVASAEAQTVPVEIIPVLDGLHNGTGWARNQGLTQATGEFVVFLDADDELTPSFVETTLKAYRPGHYIYTDWFEDEHVRVSPDCDAWIDGSFHLVTTLLPRQLVAGLGGFDESLPAIEDTDLYLKLRVYGLCGRRVATPLVHYHGAGTRSKAFKKNPNRGIIRSQVFTRYKGRFMACGCSTPSAPIMNGEHFEGDVVAEVLYAPMTQQIGNRFYRRPLHMGQRMWVNREHVQKHPKLWKLVADPEAETPDIESIRDMALEAFNESA